MARPVNGFLTALGSFFETEEEADLHDAAYELNQTALDAVKSRFNNAPEDIQEQLGTAIVQFIGEFDDIVEAYIVARRNLANKAASDEVGGQPAPTVASDGERVRDEDNLSVDDSDNAKANPT